MTGYEYELKENKANCKKKETKEEEKAKDPKEDKAATTCASSGSLTQYTMLLFVLGVIVA